MAIRVIVLLLVLGVAAWGQRREVMGFPVKEPATSPATRPGTRPATGPMTRPMTRPTVKISPDAQALLDQLNKSYTSVKSLELAGTISSDVDVAGKAEKQSAPFAAAYESPLKFRHEVPGDMLAGFDGDKAYMFKPQSNLYKLVDMPRDKPVSRLFPPELGRVLQMQNPSLLLALMKDPAEAVKAGVEEISKPDDVTLDGISYPVLKLISQKGAVVTTLLIDPRTKLLKRATFDLTKDVAGRGAPETKLVASSVDYSRIVVDASVKDVAFAWTPPAGARDAGLSGASAVGESPSPSAPAAANALAGKAAPEFRLTVLDGTEVSLEELKGNVVVLVFWAAGAGPSAQVLPQLQKAVTDKAAAGVKAYAINAKEDRGQIRPFVEKIKLTIPVLLDDGTAQVAYGADPLPVVYVIDKDGLVQKVLGGSVDQLEQQVGEAIRAAQGGK